MGRSSSFRAKLKARPTVGVVLQSASPLVAHSMSAAGFDWLVIDPINSPLSQLESFGMQTAVGDGNPTPVLMRVGGPTDRSGIQQATDTGAAGVLVPNVRSADDIVKARRPTRFPPPVTGVCSAPCVRTRRRECWCTWCGRTGASSSPSSSRRRPPSRGTICWGSTSTSRVLDVPQLCVEIGLYDELLAAPPAGDGTLASRLEPWLRVYQEPCAELAETRHPLRGTLREARQGGRRPAGRPLGGSAVPEPRHDSSSGSDPT